MGRAPCCDKANVKKGPWSPEEDAKLKAYIEKYGTGGNWIALPQKIGLKRCGKSCRLRWLNYLRPNIKHGGFTEEEDNIILSLYISIGSRWSIIAAQLPGRTDNDIKNYWNTRLKKKLLGRRKQQQQQQQQGVDGSKDEGPSLSSSALERLQLHMQLQSQHTLQNSFSFLNNPSLCPKLHPLIQEKLLQNNLQSLNQIPQFPYNNNPVNFFPQNSALSNFPNNNNNNNDNHDASEHEEVENSSLNGSVASPGSSNGANNHHNDKHGNNLGSYMEMTPGVMKSEDDYAGIQRISSFQTELNELLGTDKVTSEFEGMNGWWSNDQSNITSCWDASANHALDHSGSHVYQDYA